MDAPEISVYGEAKGEYTRQLCVFLIPCLESYFLELLEEGKAQSPAPSKHLWQFQNLLQSIPDWNQDKVIRETERIQKDCKCDYLEELLTAVFIAHTKVLSAIRLTTKQKKLQITIPKIDHFLHRVLSDCARSLWTNAYLFAETNSIEKQKNLRHVSALIQEAILQAIRGLLPVKSILREYLHEDDEDEGVDTTTVVEEVKDKEEKEDKEDKEEIAAPESESAAAPVPVEEEKAIDLSANLPSTATESLDLSANVPTPEIALVAASEPVTLDLSANVIEQPADLSSQQPMIYIDTKPSVSFSQQHIMFDSNSLEANEIHDLPFAEAELREDEDDAEDADADADADENKILTITSDYMPMDSGDSEEIL
jgi:hypothetical protein